MRLLYLIDELRARGGTERHLWELAHGMAARGHQVTVVSLEDGPPYGPEFRAAPQIHYQCLNIHRVYGPSGWAGSLRLTALIRRTAPAVVQTFHAGADLIGPVAALLGDRSAYRISSRRDLGYTKSPNVVRAQTLVNRVVDLVLANSREVAHQATAREGLPPEKVRVIYNGIDAEPFAGISVRAATPAPVVATVSNLRRVKGLHVLLDAVRQLPSLTVRIAGSGPEQESLAQLSASYGIADRVTFVGAVENVAAFLAAADIYVQPSLEEGFSNSVLEAMASALPVIATDVGGNKDIVEPGVNGLLVPVDDSAALAESIGGLALDYSRRTGLAEAGRRSVLASFTLARMLDEYERLYQDAGALIRQGNRGAWI